MSGYRKTYLLLHTLSRRWPHTVQSRPKPSLFHPKSPQMTVVSLGENMSTLRFMSTMTAANSKTSNQPPYNPYSASIDALLHSINLYAQRSGRIMDSDARILLRKLYVDSEAITPNHALFAIRCCGAVNVDTTKSDRQKLLEEFFAKCQEVKVKMDISHYNAILKAYLENDHDFSPTEILSQVTNAGLRPNRVTYQHLISKYCRDGDIDGATTILEHMKQIGMPVNEQVFKSLVFGHAKACDYESSDKVLDIMHSSGLDVNASSYGAKLEGMVLAGEPAEVINEEISKLADKGIFLGDPEYMRLIIALCNKGNPEAAQLLSSKLPRQTGYFNVLRNHIPTLIQQGQLDMALSFLTTFEQAEAMDRSNTSVNKDDNGFFVLRCVANSGAPVSEVLSSVDKLDKSEEEKKRFLGKLVPHYIRTERYDEMVEFLTLAHDKYGSKLFDNENYLVGFLRQFVPNLQSDQIEDLMVALGKVDLCRVTTLANAMLPNLFEREDIAVGIQFKVITDIFNRSGVEFSPQEVYAAVLQYNLGKDEFPQVIKEAAISSTYKKGLRSLPQLWKNSLARSYLISRDLDSFKTVYLNSSSTFERVRSETPATVMGRLDAADKALGLSLKVIFEECHRFVSDQSPEEVVNEVLETLVKADMGMSPVIADELAELLKEEKSKENLKALKSNYENIGSLWTPEKLDEFNDRMRSEIFKTMDRKARSPGPRQVSNESKDKFHRFETYVLSEMKKEPSERKLRMDQLQNLVNQYLVDGKVNKALKVKEQVNQDQTGLNLSFGYLEVKKHLIKQFELHGDVDRLFGHDIDALALTPNDQVLFHSTFFEVAHALAKQGKEQEALRAIASMENLKNNLVSECNKDNLEKWFFNLSRSIKDFDIMKDILTSITKLQILTKSDKDHYLNIFLLLNHLNNQRFEEAVQFFEDQASSDRGDIRGFRALVKELINEEHKDLLQRALDALVHVKGEEHSVYQLAAAFLSLNKSAQAGKLFKAPGLRYNHFLARNILDSFKDDNQCSEEFIKMLLPLFGTDQAFLFEKLVHLCTSDPDKIQDVWVLMQEHDYSPNDGLLAVMGEVLKEHGRNIPFEYSSKDSASQEVTEAQFDLAIAKKDLDHTMRYFEQCAAAKKVNANMVGSVCKLMVKQDDFSHFENMLKHLAEFPLRHRMICMRAAMADIGVEKCIELAPSDPDLCAKLSYHGSVSNMVLSEKQADFPKNLVILLKHESIVPYIRPIMLVDQLQSNSGDIQAFANLVRSQNNPTFAANSTAALLISDNESVAEEIFTEFKDNIEPETAAAVLKSLQKKGHMYTKVKDFFEKNGIQL